MVYIGCGRYRPLVGVGTIQGGGGSLRCNWGSLNKNRGGERIKKEKIENFEKTFVHVLSVV